MKICVDCFGDKVVVVLVNMAVVVVDMLMMVVVMVCTHLQHMMVTAP